MIGRNKIVVVMSKDPKLHTKVHVKQQTCPLDQTHFCVGFEMETVTLFSTLPSLCVWELCLFSGPDRRAWTAPEEGAEEEEDDEEEEEEVPEEVRSGR